MSSARVKWENVAARIARAIEHGRFPHGYLPAERELAAQFNVSRPTLRRALQALSDAGMLQSRPGVGNRLIETEEAPTTPRIIALALPDIANRFYVEVTEVIEYTTLQRGYQLLLSCYRYRDNLREAQLTQFATQGLSGVILGHDSSRELPPALEALRRESIPAVLLFNVPMESPFDSVVIDQQAGVDQVLRYLFSLGHHRIAFCRPLESTRSTLREDCFLKGMRDAGHAVPDEYRIPLEDLEAGPETLRRLLARKHKPTAIFAGNDRIALIVMKRLNELGVRVPEDISLVGFDNLNYTEHLQVPLTTVDQPKDLLGRRASELLFERMEQGAALPPRREVYQPRLVIRASCAARR